MAKIEELAGVKFGKLIVLQRCENYDGDADIRSQYLCLCDCGEIEKVVTRYLKSGDKKACKKCAPKKGGVAHDGQKAYWGENANIFKVSNK